jgi:predicted nucleic acid-binding protein
MAFVVDSSMSVAWMIRRQADRESRRTLERTRREAVHAPSLWPLEFLNTLLMLERRALLAAHEVQGILARMNRLQVHVETTPADNGALLRLARETRLSIYDASYLELAQRRGLPLATRDRAMQATARRFGVALA